MPVTRGAVVLSRIKPALPAAAFKSYSMRYPLRTHWRKASCAEVECDQYRLGWDSVCDISTELGRRQYDYMHSDRTRSFTETRVGPTLVKFPYGPGNKPFAGPQHEHRVKIGRPPLMLVTGGDWRGNPRGTEPLVHKNAENWADDFATHQDRLARAQS
jgi:hypothetical protein